MGNWQQAWELSVSSDPPHILFHSIVLRLAVFECKDAYCVYTNFNFPHFQHLLILYRSST